LPHAKITISNGSGEKEELIIWNDLTKPLHDFLLEFYNNKKEGIYNKISEELKSK